MNEKQDFFRFVRETLANLEEPVTSAELGALMHLSPQDIRWRWLSNAKMTELADCATMGEQREKKLFGRRTRVWHWHASTGHPVKAPAKTRVVSPLEALEARLARIENHLGLGAGQ